MNKFLKKLGLAGLGLISFTEKELSVIFNKLVKEGKMNEPEAKQFINEVKVKGGKYWDKYLADFEQKAEIAVKKVVRKIEKRRTKKSRK